MSIQVFLADDHAILRDGVRLLLEMEPDIHIVGDAADGRTTVCRVLELVPDVAILDILMPELNGIEAARQIRQANPQVQIIILTMNASPEHVFRALQVGVRGYLLKAAAGSELVKAVRAVHAGRRYLSQAISDTVIDEYIAQRTGTESDNPLNQLTDREREVLQLVVEGNSNSEIGETLNITAGSVKTYRKRLTQKLNIHDLPGLVKFAILHGLIALE